MSIDLTGINNKNEFFTQHYLATFFENTVKDKVKLWKAAAKEGANDPAQELGRLHTAYARNRGVFEEAGSAPRRVEATRQIASQLLDALGYPAAGPARVAYEDGEAAPVWREYVDASDAPRLWVVLALQTDGEGVFGALPLDADGAPAGAGEDALEDLVGALFFRTPEPARFVLVLTAGDALLCDRDKWSERRCLDFDLKEIFGRRAESTVQAMATLLACESLCPQGAPLIDELDAQSGKNASEVSDNLKYALRECVEILGNEVLYDWVHNKGQAVEKMDAGELTNQCLRYMYRILFLLFMEARPELGFAPMKSDVYLKGYSFESLRDVVADLGENIDAIGEGHYLNDSLNRLFDLVYDGYPLDDDALRALQDPDASVHDVFVVPPLKAHIFDQEQKTPLIRAARLRDCALARIIDLMSVARPAGGRGRPQRISYATLGINQLGAVYEALLSYRGFIAKEDLYEVKRANDEFNPLDVGYFVGLDELGEYTEDERVRFTEGPQKGEPRVHKKGEFIYRLAGRERETSASYYTPECLTKCLVRYALEELLQGKTAEDVLDLKVIEPAMGSAAFLNEVTNQLAEAYLRLRQEELGREVPAEQREYELQRVKMFIADRNVYGIDLNPIAVELGEVSLWLNTISRDGFVPWFGNQLHCGNSLIGARRRGYTEHDLTTKTKADLWFNKEPERIGYETGCSKSHRVYHFLVGDPGMCAYTDKVVKGLEPEKTKAMAQWVKEFTKPYASPTDTSRGDEIKTLRRLSLTVDRLWEQQIEQQRKMERDTRDGLELWGFTDKAETTHHTIREKDAIYTKYYLSEHERNAGPYARLKFAMDYWCALWFWPIEEAEWLPSREEYLMDMSLILEGTFGKALCMKQQAAVQMALPGFETPEQLKLESLQGEYGIEGNEVDIDKLCRNNHRLDVARRVAEHQHFFHWELEFADVFAEKGGFDLAIGNPPWLKLEWNEQAAMGDVEPRFAVKGYDATNTGKLRPIALDHRDAREYYLASYESVTAQKAFLNAGQNYPLLKGQRTNLYRCFLPQAWNYTNPNGNAAFIHPDGILNDSNALELRKEMGPRLRKHFQFANELKIFAGVHHHTTFSLNVYGGAQDKTNYVSISNLYDPSTIEFCFRGASDRPVEGIKTEDGSWNTNGHADRVIRVTEKELRVFGKLLGDDDWRGSRVPSIHSRQMLSVLEAIALQNETLATLGENVFSTTCWNETISRQDGTLKDCVDFPESAEETIYSSPFLGVANPLYQTTRAIYRVNSDYDLVDLTDIPEDYRVRTKYRRACSVQEYGKRMPKTPWGKPFNACYRLANREMVGCTSERTLQTALIPPGAGWVHTVFGFATQCLPSLVVMAGYTHSIPFDYFVRAAGKGHVNYATTMQYPVVDSVLNGEILARALLLNCLTVDYADLWRECWLAEYADFTWAKDDPRLPAGAFAGKDSTWTWDSPLRTDYARRQALVELDVLCSMALGLTLDQLQTVYRLDFSVLKSYEDDTYYDVNGRTVFSKKSLGPSVFSRPDFERIKGAASGTFPLTYTDDTQPGGPRERTIEYVAPFDKCDRVEDYRTAWKFFSSKYGMGGLDA